MATLPRLQSRAQVSSLTSKQKYPFKKIDNRPNTAHNTVLIKILNCKNTLNVMHIVLYM